MHGSPRTKKIVAWPCVRDTGAACYSLGLEINESAEALRRHILSQHGHTTQSDLAVVFEEDDG
jgi:hypothetical protein